MGTAAVQKMQVSGGEPQALKGSTSASPSLLTRLSSFAAVAGQAVIILLLVRRFNLENDLFQLVMQVAIGGFLLHHLLPARLKLPFFVVLSMTTIAYCLGLDQGAWNWSKSVERAALFFGIGGALIAICHLPVRFSFRVVLLLGAGVLLATFRGGILRMPSFDSVWPVFAGMFMFRTAIYLYDVENEKQKSGVWRSLAYFFLFPNLWIYVAPVIDFKGFVKSYFNTDQFAIYQKGIVWIVRGVFQLLLWRLVYYQFYVDPARVTNGADLGQYLIGNVALYLRLSAQFHIMTGLLHLFGFNLSETHRRYFLASSFVDYWRRINIYWRDFIAKLFFYPLVVRFKKLGTTGTIVAATAIAFLATWILHPYQFFWIRGTFPLESKDAMFWGALGVLVCINSISELRRGRRRTLAAHTVGWSETARTAAATAGTFMLITLLWSVWTCDSIEQWVDLWSKASPTTAAYCLAAMALIYIATFVFEGPIAQFTDKLWRAHVDGGWAPAWRKAFVCCVIPAAAMTGVTTPRIYSHFLSSEDEAILLSVFKNTPNKSDEEFMVRGYYESLSDTSRFNTLINDGFRHQPADWVRLEDTDAVRLVADLRTQELVPSKSTTVNGKLVQTNRWGLRGPEYDLIKPPGTIRLAIMGASHEMGYGVNNGEVFSDLLQNSLNQKRSSDENRRVEVLNFAVNHYSPLAQVEVMKRKVVQFRPDAILMFAHQEDVGVVMRLFAQALRQGARPEYPFLQELAKESGVNEKTPRSIAERRLITWWPSMIQWAYEQIADDCRKHGIKPVWVLQQGVFHEGISDTALRLQSLAQQAGFATVTLEDAFKRADRASLIVAPWDTHPNAEGHRLISESIERHIRELNLLTR